MIGVSFLQLRYFTIKLKGLAVSEKTALSDHAVASWQMLSSRSVLVRVLHLTTAAFEYHLIQMVQYNATWLRSLLLACRTLLLAAITIDDLALSALYRVLHDKFANRTDKITKESFINDFTYDFRMLLKGTSRLRLQCSLLY